jgi:hypothetical protein
MGWRLRVASRTGSIDKMIPLRRFQQIRNRALCAPGTKQHHQGLSCAEVFLEGFIPRR